jgi:hypothetical protein
MGCTAYSRTNIGDIAIFCLYDKLPTVLVYSSEGKCITNLAHSSEASKPREHGAMSVVSKMSTNGMSLRSFTRSVRSYT